MKKSGRSHEGFMLKPEKMRNNFEAESKNEGWILRTRKIARQPVQKEIAGMKEKSKTY